jgi:hypothetical protein
MSNVRSKVQNLTNVGQGNKVGKEVQLVSEYANMFIIITCLFKNIIWNMIHMIVLIYHSSCVAKKTKTTKPKLG